MKPAALAVASLALALACATALAETFTRSDDIGSNPVRGEIHEKLAVDAGERIEAHGLGGSVEVAGADAREVRIDYRRSAASQQDYDCEKLRYEHSGGALRIWMERERSRACRSIHAGDSLKLTVPRQAEVSLDEIGDSVSITAVEGMVRLSSIGDTATLDGVGQLRADSIGDRLEMKLKKLGPAGIRVDSVGDSVELRLDGEVGARLKIDSVGGDVTGADLHLSSLGGSFETVLGAGGPTISISSVGDDVVIRR